MVTWVSGAQAGAHSLEEESYQVLRSRIDLSRLPKFSRDVTERVIHASADFDYATDLVWTRSRWRRRSRPWPRERR
jgi:precorrin-8X/cobalt-precorrin-8 methylmutase